MNAQGVESVIIEDLIKIGEEVGIEKGMDIGLRKGLKKSVLDICEVLGIPVDDQRRSAIDELDVAGLESLSNRLKTSRAW